MTETASIAAAPSRLRGAAFIVGATLCWSANGILLRSVDLDDWTVVFYRSLFLTISLGLYLVLRHGRATPAMFTAMGPAGIVSGLLIAATFVFFVMAISRTLVANALVIMSAAPLVAAILGRVVLGEQVRRHTLWAIAAAMTGIVVMVTGPASVTFSETAALGNLFAFLVAVCFGANIVVVRRSRHVDMVPSMFLAGLFAALIAAPMAAFTTPTATDMALLAIMGSFTLGLGLFLFVRGTPHLSAAEVGLLTLLEAVLSPLWVWIGIGETPGAATLIGGAIVLTALAAHSAYGIRRSKPPVGMA